MKNLWKLSLLSIIALLCSCDREAQIITSVEPVADGEWQCFRKEFCLVSGKGVSLKVAADTKYWLYVNGELVVRD